MTMTRRNLCAVLAASLLAACSGAAPGIGQTAPDPALRPVPNPSYDAWVASFRDRAASRGISRDVLTQAFAGAGYLPGVVERDRNQTEFNRTLEDYLAIVAPEDRVQTGRAMLSRYGAVLDEIEARFGVEAEVVAAVWGVESRFGARRGDIPVISAVSTLAFDGRRGAFFEDQLMAALRILQNGDVTAANMTGSWAGAMGHTQFIPTSYEAFAVDFRGDGRRDIWSDDPTDALASTAAYLSRSGWRQGQPWGVEVQLPGDFPSGLTGRGTTRNPSDWAALGVRDMSGAPVPDHGAASILTPEGRSGPAFMVFRNFTVISRYNNAENYIIGVGHLSDRLTGGGPIRAGFAPDENGMTIDDRRALQQRLTAAGYDTGGTDGVIGPASRAAITAYQNANGLPATGEPSLELLRRLR